MLKLTPLDGTDAARPLSAAGVVDLPPDIVWLTRDGRPAAPGEPGVSGDFALADGSADGPAGGLRAANPLMSAVIACLFSDAPCEPWQLKPEHEGDFRGFPGDAIDLDEAAGEQPLGSFFWLFRREVLSPQVVLAVPAEAKRALSPLVRQGAVARVEASAEPDYARERLNLAVDLYARDGAKVFAAQFDILWRRADGRL